MSHRYAARVFMVIAVVVLVPVLTAAQSTSSAEAPRTAWGQPDLQGIWDFRTITPLQRPEELADKEFLTTEEAANAEQETIARNAELANRDARRTETTASVDQGEDGAPGFYNNFWLDGGTTSTGRTSLIIDPPNGRIPPLTPEARRLADARQEYLADHPADSWSDRNTSDRCLVGFNAGPPITPLAYNQNMQLFQTPDHVVTPDRNGAHGSCRAARRSPRRSTRTSVCGPATRGATGRATRWSSRPRISTPNGPGCRSAPRPPGQGPLRV